MLCSPAKTYREWKAIIAASSGPFSSILQLSENAYMASGWYLNYIELAIRVPGIIPVIKELHTVQQYYHYLDFHTLDPGGIHAIWLPELVKAKAGAGHFQVPGQLLQNHNYLHFRRSSSRFCTQYVVGEHLKTVLALQAHKFVAYEVYCDACHHQFTIFL